MNSNKEAYQGYMAGDKRYAGPKDEQGQEQDKKIDIGLYEYQYPTNLYSLDASTWLRKKAATVRGRVGRMLLPTCGAL